ncbi:hypothetical protein L7F22_039177 [Adiantum nelumboides]|nr:hypothetical protein [Adiantum nelumboides]
MCGKSDVPLPSRITPWLFVGSLEEANAPAEVLSDLGIVQIINVTHNIEHVHNSRADMTTFKHVRIPVKDLSTTRIDVHFQRVATLIHDCMHLSNTRKGATLLHCFEGVSRSVTLGIASMMIMDKITLKEALEVMRTERPIIEPNPGFLHQLQQLDAQLQGQIVRYTPQEHIVRWTTIVSTQDNNISLRDDNEIQAKLFKEACQAVQETLDDGKTLEGCIRYCMELFATSTERDALARDSFAQVLIRIAHDQNTEIRTRNNLLIDRFDSLLISEDWQDFCLDAPLANKFACQMINQIKAQ